MSTSPVPAQRDEPASGALYRRLFGYVWPYKGVFALGLVGMLLAAAGDTGFAYMLQPIMDKGFVERDASYIRYIPLALCAIAVVRAIGDFIDSYCIEWVSRKVIQDLRQAMFERLVHAPAEFFDHQSTGALVSRLTYDVEQVARASSAAFRTLVRDLIKSIFLLSLMFYLSWKLSLIFVAVIPMAWLIFRFTSGRFRRISSHIQESVGDISHIARQAFQGHRLVKIFGAYDTEKETFLRANNRNRQQSMKKAGILAASVPLLIMLIGIGVAVVIWLALRLEIQPGVFTSYLVSMTMIVRPVKNLSKVNEMIQTGMAGAESIFRTIDEHVESDAGTRVLDSVRGDVAFEDVSFHYSDDDTEILSGIRFSMEAGTTTALVGASGSGKSTIASMLMRFYRPTAGRITLDGIPIEDLTLASLRSQAAIVSQEVMLFDDTIRNNIVYGARGGIDEARLAAACAASNVDEFTAELDHGLDTEVGEGGARLSGGQRQRIAIARALYRDAPILILDEATSSLDSRSEQHIQHAIDHLISTRTTLVIAHRLSTIENADQILVLDKGRIVEQGSHQELLDRKGLYHELHSTQYHANGEDDR